MSPPGRPKGDGRRVQHDGIPVNPGRVQRLPRTAAALLWASCLCLISGAMAQAPALQPQRVVVPSLDQKDGAAVMLPGYWFAGDAAEASPLGTTDVGPGTARAAAKPALVLLHGCGGVFGRGQQLAVRYTELAATLAQLGVQALVVDSLSPRGERELCTQRVGQRQTTQLQRRRDALGALQWLASQPGVDRHRTGLLGWSNGGSTVLSATNLAHPEVARAPAKPSLAVAFYPGCVTERDRGYRPVAPLLMLLGEADDWTPAAPCKELAASVNGTLQPQWVSYEGAHHGFDGTAAVRFRTDVPNGAPGQGGVHVGGQPLARSLSAQRLREFLLAQWKLAPGLSAPAPSSPPAAALPVSPPAAATPGTVDPTETPSSRTGS